MPGPWTVPGFEPETGQTPESRGPRITPHAGATMGPAGSCPKSPDEGPEMARPAGLEPATCRLEGGCSIQLSQGRTAGMPQHARPAHFNLICPDACCRCACCRCACRHCARAALIWRSALRCRENPVLRGRICDLHRGVAQPGSASALGAEGRRFESYRPDHHSGHRHRNLSCLVQLATTWANSSCA